VKLFFAGAREWCARQDGDEVAHGTLYLFTEVNIIKPNCFFLFGL
jgi:hypothetical protein